MANPLAQTYCKIHFVQRWKARGDGGAKHQGQPDGGESNDISDGGGCSDGGASARPSIDAYASNAPASTVAHLEARKQVLGRFSAFNSSIAHGGEGSSPRAAPAPNRVLPAWATDNQARCVRCGKNVYAMEKRTARSHDGDQQVYHDKCFRCAECNTLLRNNNFELLDGVTLLCKAHFLSRRSASSQDGQPNTWKF